MRQLFMILQTERLILKEMKQTDFQDLAEILQNPKVMYAYKFVTQYYNGDMLHFLYCVHK